MHKVPGRFLCGLDIYELGYTAHAAALSPGLFVVKVGKTCELSDIAPGQATKYHARGKYYELHQVALLPQ